MINSSDITSHKLSNYEKSYEKSCVTSGVLRQFWRAYASEL